MQNVTQGFQTPEIFKDFPYVDEIQAAHSEGPPKTICPCCKSAILVKIPIVDLNTNTVSWQGKSTKLTPQQACITHVLVQRFPGAVAINGFISRVWGSMEPEDAAGVMRVRACQIRKKLRPMGWNIKCEYGGLYRLELAQ